MVTQLVEALCYRPEGRGFDSRWGHWNLSLTQSFCQHYGPGVESASNRNEYQEYFLGGKDGWRVGLTTLPLSCANCLEIWELQLPGTLRACQGLQWDCFTVCNRKPLYPVPYKYKISVVIIFLASLWASVSICGTHWVKKLEYIRPSMPAITLLYQWTGTIHLLYKLPTGRCCQALAVCTGICHIFSSSCFICFNPSHSLSNCCFTILSQQTFANKSWLLNFKNQKTWSLLILTAYQSVLF